MKKLLFVALLISACASAPQPIAVAAGPTGAECRPNPHIGPAREAYDDLRFDDAAALLQRALEHHRNCREDLAEIYRLKGNIDAING